jgi:hypothetical protein
MRKLYIVLFAIFIAEFIASCATEPKLRAASEYLFSTDKGTSILFGDLKDSLDHHKYKMEKQDDTAGILLMAPKVFSFQSGPNKVFVRQVVQMRQEGGSLKIRMAYDCNYLGDRKTFEPCLDEDDALANKISRMEAAFVEVLKPTLHAERQPASAHSIDDKPLDPK